MSTIEKRQEFETEVQNYISNLVKDQNEYLKMETNYINYNDKIKGNIDPNSLIEILSENYSPFENIYSKENYPNMEMFLISKYPNMKELSKCLEIIVKVFFLGSNKALLLQFGSVHLNPTVPSLLY